MKRYLVCSFLVINAVPTQAAQAEWCKGYWGCQSVTSVTDAVWLTAAAQKEAEQKKLVEAEALTRKRKQDELNNVPNRVQIIAVTQETLESNKNLVQNLKKVYSQEDAAIAAINAEDTQALVALLEACKDGSAAKCAEHKARIDLMYERSVTSNQRGTQQGALDTNRAKLAQDLVNYKDEILAAYDAMREVAAQEQKEMEPLTQKRNQATLACDEGNACNQEIEAMDKALAACKDAAQEKRREAKAKLDNAWKKYLATRDRLNDVSDINAIAKAFAIKYSVKSADIVMTQDTKAVVAAKSGAAEPQVEQVERKNEISAAPANDGSPAPAQDQVVNASKPAGEDTTKNDAAKEEKDLTAPAPEEKKQDAAE